MEDGAAVVNGSVVVLVVVVDIRTDRFRGRLVEGDRVVVVVVVEGLRVVVEAVTMTGSCGITTCLDRPPFPRLLPRTCVQI